MCCETHAEMNGKAIVKQPKLAEYISAGGIKCDMNDYMQ
jgi:hypothetical protein